MKNKKIFFCIIIALAFVSFATSSYQPLGPDNLLLPMYDSPLGQTVTPDLKTGGGNNRIDGPGFDSYGYPSFLINVTSLGLSTHIWFFYPLYFIINLFWLFIATLILYKFVSNKIIRILFIISLVYLALFFIFQVGRELLLSLTGE